jgi:hypothetical protein
MKMGDRRCKRLDKLGVDSMNKPRLTLDPKNRSERQALARLKRKVARQEKPSWLKSEYDQA